ncbi:Csu type fimbrial protein [Gluconacetobacter tumulisoli]|uniref:Spore coat protein U domain-containing protein n=1 Tax=Gluconacetobacter tumulisoli TaxID=1286189 RepID=A0A7W4K536_9PROT|nr:spore coat U domain-containing protein [Gluconacetobacter tumulisoli]MBB2200570.1 spore coat protein U domain-containing protein [Gluconacetobacter tumulisoli]
MAVSAIVTAGCEIDGQVPADGGSVGSFGTLDFGSQPSLSTETLTGTLLGGSGVTISCTPGVAASMQVDGGRHDDGTTRNLQLAAGSAQVPYRLYSDSAETAEIPPGLAVTLDTSTTPGAVTLPLYGRLALPGTGPAGTYADTLTITLQW